VVLEFLLNFDLLCWLDCLEQANNVFLVLAIALQLYLVLFSRLNTKVMIVRALCTECSSHLN
jgi:hypothetical protein